VHLMKWNSALVILMAAGCQFGLAQSKESAAKDSVQLIARLEGPSSVEGFAFSPDGKILAASYPWHAVIFWDVAKGEQHATLDDAENSLRNSPLGFLSWYLSLPSGPYQKTRWTSIPRGWILISKSRASCICLTGGRHRI